MTLLVAVLLLIGRPERIVRFDVLERNTVVSEDGRETLRQLIAWDWDHSAGVHRCQWWSMDRGEEVRRTADGWRVTVGGRRIEARAYRVTRTGFDPELADREKFDTAKRKGVR